MQRLDQPVPFRGGGFAPRSIPLAAAATLLGLIALWQAGSSAGWIPDLFLPAPVGVAQSLWGLTVSGELWQHLQRLIEPAGDRLDAGHNCGNPGRTGGRAVHLARSPGMAVVSALFPIPKIALVPLFIIWFGIGEGIQDRHPGLRRVLPHRDQHRRRRR